MWLDVPWIIVLSRGEGALAPSCRVSKGYYQIWEINARFFKLLVFWFCFGDPFWAFMNWFWFGLGTGRIKAILIFNHNPVGSFWSALIHFHLVLIPNMRVAILFDLYSWCSCSPILIFIWIQTWRSNLVSDLSSFTRTPILSKNLKIPAEPGRNTALLSLCTLLSEGLDNSGASLSSIISRERLHQRVSRRENLKCPI